MFALLQTLPSVSTPITPDPRPLARLAISFAAQPFGAPNGGHSADLRLLDPEGMVVQRCSGAPVAVGRLVDIRQLAYSNIALR